MKRPGILALILGHPILAGPLLIFGVLGLLRSWQIGSDGALAAIAILVAMAQVLKASEQASKYRAWVRAWKAMDEQAAGPPQRWRRVGGVIFLVLLAAYGAGQLDRDQLQGAIAIAAIPLALVILWAGTRWARRRMPRGRRRECVSVAVGAPLMRVPKLQAAYRALPEHCQRVLGEQARQ